MLPVRETSPHSGRRFLASEKNRSTEQRRPFNKTTKMETKIMKIWKRRDVLGAMLAAPALALPARAQEAWPTKQVTFLVPFGAGGTTDILARLIGQHMQQKSGKPFVVENRPGAGGNTGSAWVAKQPPDGHTILFCSVSTHAISQFIYPT